MLFTCGGIRIIIIIIIIIIMLSVYICSAIVYSFEKYLNTYFKKL